MGGGEILDNYGRDKTRNKSKFKLFKNVSRVKTNYFFFFK